TMKAFSPFRRANRSTMRFMRRDNPVAIAAAQVAISNEKPRGNFHWSSHNAGLARSRLLAPRRVATQSVGDWRETRIFWIFGQPFHQVKLRVAVRSFLEKQQQTIEMTMSPGAVQHCVSTRILGIHIRA